MTMTKIPSRKTCYAYGHGPSWTSEMTFSQDSDAKEILTCSLLSSLKEKRSRRVIVVFSFIILL